VRPHDYQTEVTLQHEVLPRVSAEISYIHRTFHGFFVTNDINRNVETDWVSYEIDAPIDARLPDGGGYPILVYVPIATGAAQNFLTRESRYGDGEERRAYYDGINVNVNARMRGLFVSMGTQTGRRNDNRCHILPNITTGGGPNPRNCRDYDPFQTTVRGLASYTLPRVDVLVSGTVRSQPPLARGANWVVPNDRIIGILGFTPPGMNPLGNSTIAVVDSDHRLWADNRRTQIDMRFAKVVRLGGTRTDIGVDLWNLLNTNYATGFDNQYADDSDTWGRPTSIYAPRFVRLNFTVNF
jgi:hypothetical protein